MSPALLLAAALSAGAASDDRPSEAGCVQRATALADVAVFAPFDPSEGREAMDAWLSEYTMHVAKVDSSLLSVVSSCEGEAKSSALEIRGELYRGLVRAMLTMPPPSGLSRAEAKARRKATEQQVCPLVQKAWDADAERGVESPDWSDFAHCRRGARGARH